MLRLFVALALPRDIAGRLAAMQQPLPRSRWVAPESMHVTLRFIGEVSNDVAADVDDMLARVTAEPFDMYIGGVGRFASKGRLRALWAGVERSEPLLHLQARIETACQRAGLDPEGRKFHPHVTLARCRDIREELARPFLAAHDGLYGDMVRVEEFVLYSSRLGHAGPSYTPEARYPLGGAAGELADEERFAELAREWPED
ncbi:MAG: RNA 2',3'-cyclic phosphodiesterase [Alphaproteobacteria bacterium]|jgi:2'-5' RNA ligase